MRGSRKTVLLLALVLVLAACQSGSGRNTGNGAGKKAAGGAANDAEPKEPEVPHERFLANPTVVRARSIQVILPAAYRDEIETEGLSAGWQELNGRRVWEGSGEVEVRLRKLVLTGPSVTVTLVEDQPEPEVMIQATGDVSFGHLSKGLSTQWEGKAFLMIRNDRWVEQ